MTSQIQSADRLGIGIVGAGGIALSHMASLRASPTARLVSICDSVPGRAQDAARIDQCRWTTSIEDLLADPDVQAVILCTPNNTHEPLGHLVLAAGKHLLMEKPLAMSVEGAEELARKAEEQNLALAVGHSHRFSDQSLAIRDVIDAGTVGKPLFVRITINGGWIWPGWHAWVLDPAISGGHSLHNGVHLMDLARWWMGETVTTVSSRGQKVTSAALGIHDYLVTELGFQSGASAICEISRAEQPRNSALFEVLVTGTKGTITREWDANGIRAWSDQGFQAWNPQGTIERMYSRELEAFVVATQNPQATTPPIKDAIVAIQMAVASETSLKTGLTVDLQDGAPSSVVAPTLDTDGELGAPSRAEPVIPQLLGARAQAHSGFRRAITAIQGAEIGLLRAVAVDLVVLGAGQPSDGHVNMLLAEALDLIRISTGRAEVRFQAHHWHPSNVDSDSWAFLGQTERDVVVSFHAATIEPSARNPAVQVARIRFAGTHGWILVDLLRPQLQVITAQGPESVTIGENPARALLPRHDHTHSAYPKASSPEAAGLASTLSELVKSAQESHEGSISW